MSYRHIIQYVMQCKNLLNDYAIPTNLKGLKKKTFPIEVFKNLCSMAQDTRNPSLITRV